MKAHVIAGNLLFVLLLGASIAAFIADQKDKAAARPATQSKITQYRLDYALKNAKARNKILMVEFGANWCEDCIVLARNLEDLATKEYFQKHFILLTVDIGPRSDRNLDVAESLGLDLNRGIPAAVFFAPDGTRIGATNNGELEPSRKYTPQQILAFLKNVAEQRTIAPPGAPDHG